MGVALRILAASAALCLAGTANATVIDFGGLSGGNGSAFTGPYVEDTYTVGTTSGEVFEGHAFGNPAPSLVVGGVFGGLSHGSIEITNAFLFQLTSWDQTSQNGDSTYRVEGYDGATLLYTLTGSVPGVPGGVPWLTIAGNSTSVNRLVFTLTTQGTSTNFDNVVLDAAAPVPEPGTWALMIVGFGAAGFAMRRARAKSAVAIA
jgi:hypothetical protein